MFKLKKNKRLIISCPTWHIEKRLQQQTNDKCYFMNILAGIYIEDELFIDQLLQTIKNNKIDKLSVVANPNCSFVKNILQPHKNLETQAEEVITRLYHKKYDLIHQFNDQSEKQKALAYYCAQFSLGRILQDLDNQSININQKPETSILTYGEMIKS